MLEDLDITEAPEEIQRRLYDALRLQIFYDRPRRARFRLVLTDDTIDAIAAPANRDAPGAPIRINQNLT